MIRPGFSIILIYALILGLAAFALQWLEYRFFLQSISTELYIVLLAVLFVSLGIWVGHRLTAKEKTKTFERNDPALKSLGISGRELEVLEAMARGQSNKEIARTLGVSPNTIKTHVAHLFEKLAVDRRMLAIEKARSLHLIP